MKSSKKRNIRFRALLSELLEGMLNVGVKSVILPLLIITPLLPALDTSGCKEGLGEVEISS